MTQPLVLIAAGGTGGHMFPAQALAEAMLAKGWRVKLSTDARGARYTGGFPHTTEIEQNSSATFARGGLLAKLRVPFSILRGVLSAWAKMRRDRPNVVVGFGGYPAIPAMAAAWLMGLPRMVHEQNGVLGRVNQLFARRVNAVACGTWPTQLPDGVTGQNVGNPVRSAVLARAGAPYLCPNARANKIVVIGGSQGARILSRVIPQAIALLPDTLRRSLTIVQQAREDDSDLVRARYAEIGVSAQISAFIHDVPDQLSEAQLVISRAGASSVADISVIGRPSILVPLAVAIRDEQTANARGLVDAGAAILMPENRFTPEALAQSIELVLDAPDGARKMAKAALGCAKPDATANLVSLVETLAEKGEVT